MFLKRDDPHLLVVGMTGVKMGDRFVQIGCAHGGRLAAVAARSACRAARSLVAPDEASAARARKGAAEAGVLVEVEIAPPTRCRSTPTTFDLAVVDDTGGCLARMRADGSGRRRCASCARVLRPGGRVMVIGAGAARRPRRAALAARRAVRRFVASATRSSARSRRLQVGAHARRARRAGVRRGIKPRQDRQAGR